MIHSSNSLPNRRDILKLALITPVAGLLSACIGDDTQHKEVRGSSNAESGSPSTDSTASVVSPEITPTAETPATTPTLAATSAIIPSRDPMRQLTMLGLAKASSMNPYLEPLVGPTMLGRICLEPLFDFDADARPVLVLGAEWPAVENGLLDPAGMWVTWPLRQQVKWQDGEDFTAEDVAFTFEYARSGLSSVITLEAAEPFQFVESVEVIDRYTVRIHFDRPNPNWFEPFRGGQSVILPEHVFRPTLDNPTPHQQNLPMNQRPIGTGPFKAVGFDPHTHAEFERFDDYWGPDTPYFESLYIGIGGPSTDDLIQHIIDEPVGYAFLFGAPADEALATLDSAGAGTFVQEAHTSVERLFFNFIDPATAESQNPEPHPLLSDVRVRQAISMVIDREHIVREIRPHQAQATSHLLAGPEDFQGPGFPDYDLDAALGLMSEAGVNGGHLIIQSSSGSPREAELRIIAQALEQLGFSVELKLTDAGVYFSMDPGRDTIHRFNADLQLFSDGPQSPYPLHWFKRLHSGELATPGNNWSGANFAHYSSPEFDRLYEQAMVEMVPDRQAELWQEMMTLVTDDVIEVPIYRLNSLAVVDSRISGRSHSLWAVDPSWDLKNWRYD